MNALRHRLCENRSGFVRWAVERLVKKMIPALLVAFLSIAVSGDRVDAACGDYLHVPHREAGLSENLRAVFPTNIDQVGNGQYAPLGSSVPRCSGPSCRPSQSLPFDRPPAELRLSSAKDACELLLSEVTRDDQWILLTRSSDRLAESPDRNRLDRPPQLA